MIITRNYKPNFSAAMLAWLILLQGCATLDKEECQLADWRMIGYEDGVRGKSATAIGEYREDCAKHAVVPDLAAYRAGREEGLLEYCKADNGYRLGNAGRSFAAVCPTALEKDFRDAWDSGRKLYLARSAVNTTRSRINDRRQTLSTLKDNKAQKLSALISDGLKADQRVMILYDLNELEKEMNLVEDEIVDLELDLEDQQARLDRLDKNGSF